MNSTRNPEGSQTRAKPPPTTVHTAGDWGLALETAGSNRRPDLGAPRPCGQIDRLAEFREPLRKRKARVVLDPVAVAPCLGHYEKGWSLAFDPDGALRLRQSSRAIRVMAMPDGSYVMAGGFAAGLPIQLLHDENDVPWLNLPQLERVRWSVGPAA